MKQMKKLTRDQKIMLSREGKNPKEYMWCERMRSFVRKDGKQEEMADSAGLCGK